MYDEFLSSGMEYFNKNLKILVQKTDRRDSLTRCRDGCIVFMQQIVRNQKILISRVNLYFCPILVFLHMFWGPVTAEILNQVSSIWRSIFEYPLPNTNKKLYLENNVMGLQCRFPLICIPLSLTSPSIPILSFL